MKKILLSLSLLAFTGSALMLTSCQALKKKIKDEANVDINYDFEGADATFEIPVITTTNETVYPDTASVPLNLNDKITAASALLSMKNIQKVIVTEAKLVFNNCDAQNNASNFSTALVVFHSNTNPERKLIATNDEVLDVNSAEIPLAISENIDLLEYLKTGTSVFYTAGVNMRRPTTKILNATLKIKYKLVGNTGYGE